MSTVTDNYPKHSTFDDCYGLFTGVALAAMGIATLSAGGLITGGAAGMALLISYLVPYTPAQLVPLINAPFILFSVFAMGRAFAGKTLAVSLCLGVAVHICAVMLLPHVSAITAAVFGSMFLGIGILFMARHGASIGGTGIVTLWGQRRFKVNAGLSQCAFDAVLFVVAAFSQPWDKLAISFVGVVIMNSCLMCWHRDGRYRG